MAGIAFPSWAYNSAGQASQIVASQAAFNLLPGPGTWSFSPFIPPSQIAPGDPGFSITDDRLQQMLIEARIQSQYLYYANGSVGDDPQALRADILATDSSITS